VSSQAGSGGDVAGDRARVLKPPAPLDALDDAGGRPVLFLAGSIEMGHAEPWQQRVEEALADLPLVLLNPRRDDWDSSWEQRLDNPPFREQVEWELSGLERADLVLVYFAPGTKSPVTLLELGLFARSDKLLVCCPEGFWRKGNVDVVCARYVLDAVDTFEALLARAQSWARARVAELEVGAQVGPSGHER
jgi:hypothetical protein